MFKDNGTVRMTTTREYYNLNRLRSIRSTTSPASGAPQTLSYTYVYNAANQRGRVILADGSYRVYEYDRLGQVVSGRKFWADGTPVAGQQFEYRFDDIGNRTQTRARGDEQGQNLRTATYTPNLLDQSTQPSAPAGSRRRLPFAYDWMGRRIWKKVTNRDTGEATERKFLYDGCNPIALFNASTSTSRTTTASPMAVNMFRVVWHSGPRRICTGRPPVMHPDSPFYDERVWKEVGLRSIALRPMG